MFSQISSKLINFFGSLSLIVILFGSGYYFGYQGGVFNAKKESDKIADNLAKNSKNFKNGIEISNQNSQSIENKPSSNLSKPNQIITLNEQIKFFKTTDSNRNCPAELQVKGVFSSDLGYFYTKDNKQFDRVKADICFDSIETAREIAGFVQKF